MKINKELGLATTLIMLSLYCLFITGCSTITQPNNVVIEQAIIESAAQAGTFIALQKYPQTKPDFILGDSILFSLANSTNLTLTPQDIDNAFTNANLNNPVITTVIDNGVLLIDNLNINLGTNQGATILKNGLKFIAIGCSNGISESN